MAALHSQPSPMNSGAGIPLALPLPGRFQVRNALTALAAARMLAGTRRGRSMTAPSRAASPQPYGPAGWSASPGSQKFYLDGAHNPSGAREIAVFWQTHFAWAEHFTSFMALCATKPSMKLPACFSRTLRRWILTSAGPVPRHLRSRPGGNDRASRPAR